METCNRQFHAEKRPDDVEANVFRKLRLLVLASELEDGREGVEILRGTIWRDVWHVAARRLRGTSWHVVARRVLHVAARRSTSWHVVCCVWRRAASPKITKRGQRVVTLSKESIFFL